MTALRRRLDVPHVLVCGSRDFRNRKLVIDFVRGLPLHTMLVSGGAAGPDAIAAGVAKLRKMAVLTLTPAWATVGNAAGIERNAWMLDILSAHLVSVVAFWNGTSSGTHDMLKRCDEAREWEEYSNLKVLGFDEDGSRWAWQAGACHYLEPK